MAEDELDDEEPKGAAIEVAGTEAMAAGSASVRPLQTFAKPPFCLAIRLARAVGSPSAERDFACFYVPNIGRRAVP